MMERFSNFNEEKGVSLTGGGKTITLQKGQQVSFKHAITGKQVSGTFTKKVHRGGFQYAHVQMPDKTAMHVPVHHIKAGTASED